MKKIIAIPVILSLVVFCFGTGWAVAQTIPAGEKASVRELFIPVSPDALSAQPLQDRPDREVVRSRFVRVNLDRLAEIESIDLNFFDDVTITAIREKVEKRSVNRYTWFGEVLGKEFSDVILTIENGILVGGVRIDGKLYRVEPLEDGLHIVRQLDPSAFPRPRDNSSDVRVPDRDFGTTPLRDLQESAFHPDDPSTIDIMVVYTDDAASSSIGAQIQYAIDVTNATYEKSFIAQRLRLVHTAQVNYAETGNADATLLDFTLNMPEVQAWRDKYRADIVSLWVEGTMDCRDWDLLCLFGGTAGIGWLWGAHNVVMRNYASDDFVLAHESGHNMGAGHDIHTPEHAGHFPYSHGYVWTGWTGFLWYCRPTVMAYSDYCYNNGYWLTTERIGRWSNPDIDWRVCEAAGWPCTNWTRIGDPDVADNARTLNETAYEVANFRRSCRLQMVVTNVGDNSMQLGSWYSTGTFAGFSPVYGTAKEPPALAVFNNRQYIAVKTPNGNQIYVKYQDELGNWYGWEHISGATSASPALAVFNDRLYMAVKGGSSNNIYLRSMDGSGTWDSSWTQVPGATSEAPALAVFNNRLYLFVKGANSTGIFFRSMDTTGTWDPWGVLPGGTNKPIGLTVFNDRFYVFVKGASTNNIFYRSRDTSWNWSSWATLPGQTTERPSVTALYDRLYVAVKGASGSNAYVRSMNRLGEWEPSWTMIPANTDNAPVLSAF